jgi:hypothetical protein
MQSLNRKVVVLTVAAAALAVTVLIWRAKAQTVISAGYDQFSTPANAVTQETLTLPAGALKDEAGSPSKAFSGQVTFQGGAAVAGYNGDTVIERTQNVTVPGSTALQVIGVNLVSVGKIAITFEDNSSANYSVSVSQSASTESTGTMSFAANNTFTNTLNVNVEYTFTATGEPTGVFDAAANGVPAIAFSSSGTWEANGSGEADIIRRIGEDHRIGADVPTTGRDSSGAMGANGAVAGGGVAGPDAATGPTGPTGVTVTIVPNTEQSALAKHGIGPPPCTGAVDSVTGVVTKPCLQSPELKGQSQK